VERAYAGGETEKEEKGRFRRETFADVGPDGEGGREYDDEQGEGNAGIAVRWRRRKVSDEKTKKMPDTCVDNDGMGAVRKQAYR
jgi:hypothetical protein